MVSTEVNRMNTIFIQIASYRDPQLLPTIKDCLTQAQHPENLRFGIARQYSDDDSWEDIDCYRNNPNFKIIDIDYRKSKGACWARNKLQQLYNGEKFTLQLDSHHRFAKNWDTDLIDMFNGLVEKGHKKPLITGYIPSFDPENDPEKRVGIPWKMRFDRFIPEGAIFFMPSKFDKKDNPNEPLAARFYSAHFAFTVGDFAKEVRHDPEYYFHGEEISIAVRAFTHGYDLFHPHKVLCWHEYTRKGRTKQWDDDKTWTKKNEDCHKKNRQLFGMDENDAPVDMGEYGFGKERTLTDYEKYAGIKFSTRSVNQDVLDDALPLLTNTSISDKDFEATLLSYFEYTVKLDPEQLPENDYDFLVFAFRDENRVDMYRKDVTKEEVIEIKEKARGNKKNKIEITRGFNTKKRPSDWIVWPHSISKDWQDAIIGHLGYISSN